MINNEALRSKSNGTRVPVFGNENMPQREAKINKISTPDTLEWGRARE